MIIIKKTPGNQNYYHQFGFFTFIPGRI